MDAARRRLALVLALTALPVALPGVPAALASPTQESVFMDDNRLLYRGDEVSDQTLQELRALGVDRVRVSVHWRAIAPGLRAERRPASLSDPTDPDQYPPENFNSLDHLLRVAKRMGMGVIFNVTGGAPLWATGKLKGRHVGFAYRPSPAQFAQFVEMLGRRYDGTRTDTDQGRASIPRVEVWSIWNEPNQGALLQPQWARDRRGTLVPYSPRLYRRLVRAALAGLARSGHAGDTILLGETAPRGADRPGLTRPIRPGLFLRELFCLGSDLRPLRGAVAAAHDCDFRRRGGLQVSGYAHHPYSVTSPPQRPDRNPDDMTLADRDRLVRMLDAAAAAGRVPRGLPLWYTEYGYQTNPPDPLRGVSLDQQAAWSSEAEWLTWRDSRVVAHTQFLLRDDAPRRGEAAEGSSRYWGTYQSGLTFEDGSKKPAYDAYRLPLYAVPGGAPGGPVRLWGFVRAGENGVDQTVRIEYRADGAADFTPVGDPVRVTDPRGYFEVEVTPPGPGAWRFTWTPPAQPRAKDPNPLGGLLPADPPPAPPTYASRPVAVGAG